MVLIKILREEPLESDLGSNASLTSCISLSKLFNCCELWFPQVEMEMTEPMFTEVWWGLNVVTHIKHLVESIWHTVSPAEIVAGP